MVSPVSGAERQACLALVFRAGSRMTGKRETYTHRPKQITDEQLAANWEGINWNAREALPDLPSDQGSDSQEAEKEGA